MRFKIDWASLIVGSKFIIFALFFFVFEGNFPNTSPRGAYIWRGDLTEGFLHYRFGGLYFGGAYFRNFTVFPLYFLLNGVKWIRISVDTFGHLNPQFNPGVYVALLTLLTYPVSTSPAKFNFSIMKRLKTALRCTMTEIELLQF